MSTLLNVFDIVYFRSDKTFFHFKTLLFKSFPLSPSNKLTVTSVGLNAKSRHMKLLCRHVGLCFFKCYKYTHKPESNLHMHTDIIYCRYTANHTYSLSRSFALAHRHEKGRLHCEFRPCLVGVFLSGETRPALHASDAMYVTRATTKGHIHTQSLQL